MTYEEIKAYCIKKDSATKTFLDKIDTAIAEYEKQVTILSNEFTAVIRGMYAVETNNQLVFSNDEKLGIVHNGKYGSIDNCWYEWKWVNDNTGESFYKKFTYIQDEAGEPILAGEQPFIDIIVEEILSARQKEKSKLEAFADSLWEYGNKNGIIAMFEDRGEILQTPNRKDIAKKIYVDNGMYEMIKKNNLDVYIPTYMGELC